MFRKINVQGLRGILLLACAAFAVSFALSYVWAQQSSSTGRAAASIIPLGRDRDQDGLSGPVNRVRTETAKLSISAGKLVEGPRELLESTTYDPKGKRVDSTYFLVAANSQAGRQEYVYDEKGNVSEMTVRDGDGKISSREVYAYEYDALGNWIKMTASAVVYESGKVAPQPTEVTYRNISYYFDQAIAEIAKPNSSGAENGPASGQNDSGNFSSLRGALEGWVVATNARDLEGLMKFYSPRMDSFYRARNVSQDVVRADRTRLFQRAESVAVNIGDPEITMTPDGPTAVMRFRKQYVIRVDGRERRGEVIQQLQWQRTDEGWRIVGERDLRVLRKG
ncbi:MAG TPA: nuclear transport factor 2 family protein [Pyrinomonadaceae bacterium]